MKRLIILLAILALMLPILADTVTIGTGTGTTSYFPFYGLYGYNYTQQIYTQSQINTAGNITKIRFFYVSGSIATSKDWVIYMGHTNQSSFDTTTSWIPLSSLTQVFAGDVTSLVPAANNWMEITLNTPFPYNNTQNLVIAVDENTPSYSSMSWGGFTSGTNTGICYYNDSTNPDPASPPAANYRSGTIDRIQLVFPSTTAPNAPVLVAPANGATFIQNPVLSWNNATSGGDATAYDVYFGTNSNPPLLAADITTRSYTVSGTVPSTTYYWKVVAKNSIGSSTPSETWSFTTMPAGIIVVGTGTSTQRQPFGALWGYERSAAIYKATQINSFGLIQNVGWYNATAATSTLPYKIYMGTTTSEVFTAQTWSTIQAGLTLVKEGTYSFNRVGWHNFALSAPFAYTAGNLIVAVEVNYGGTGGGSGQMFNYTVGTSGNHIYWNTDNNPPTVAGTLSANVPNLMMQITSASQEPVFNVSPTSWDFPLTVINTANTKQFNIANSGEGVLNINNISISGAYFSLENNPAPVSLSFGQSANFTVKYLPTAAGTHQGTVSITHGRTVTTVALTGSCTDPTISTLPYTQNFDTLTVPNLPVGWTVLNPDNESITWRTETTYPLSAPNNVGIGYTPSGTGPLNDWLITPPVALTAGVEYRIGYNYKAKSTSYTESLAFYWGTAPTAAALTNNLATHASFNSATYALNRVLFTPSVSGSYFFGWHAYSINNQLGIAIDDIEIMVAPTTPILVHTPTTLDFGATYVGTPTAYQNVTVKNNGGGTLNIAAANVSLIGAGASQFQIDTSVFPLALTTDQSAIIPIRFAPATTGDKQATFRIVNSQGRANYDVPLSGYAVAANALLESFEPTTFPPAGWANPGTWSRGTSYAVHGTAAAYKAGTTSAQYILSTPMLSPVAGSQFRFWSRSSVANSVLQLVYSTDRTTWTQVGTDLNHPTINTWQNNIIDLSSLAGTSYYFGIRTGLQAATFYVDLVIGPAITPVLPGIPTLSTPADAAVNQITAPTLTWTAPTTGGIVNSYNIYIGTTQENMTVYGTSTTNSYTVTPPLQWNTTYYWKVSAVNNAGEGTASAVRSFTTMADPTVSTFPWLQDFSGSTFPPTNWNRLSGLYPSETPTATTSGWVSANFANISTPANTSARLNVWSTSTKYWLVTPPLAIPATGYELKFDLALTTYSGANPVTPGGQADDRFIVLISDSPSMINATVLREWNNTGSQYVYDNISTTGQNVSILLSAYAGTKYIAFYGESTVSNGDNNVYVDNVIVREAPTGPPNTVVLTSPANAATNLPKEGFNLQWNPAITGGYPSEYSLFMGPSLAALYDNAFYNLTATSFNPVTDGGISFSYSQTWYWTVMASNGDGDADLPTPFSFTIEPDPRITSLPYSQNFDGVPTGTVFPKGWTAYKNNTSASLTISSSYSQSPSNSVYMYNSAVTDVVRLISSQVMVPMNSIKLKFYLRAGGTTNYSMKVGTVSALDGSGVFTEIATITPTVSAAFEQHTVSFANYTGTDHYICFQHGVGTTAQSFYLDNIYMEQLVANDLAVTGFTGASYGFAGQALNFNVNVLNNGTATQNAYAIQLINANTSAILSSVSITTPLAANSSADIPISWTPGTTGTYNLQAKVVLAGDANPANNLSNTLTMEVFAANTYKPYVGNPATTTSSYYLPINMYYKNSVAETIYLEHEMQMMAGTINAITYKINFTQDLTKPIKIWMGHTTDSVNSAWQPMGNLTLVFDGAVHFPIGINTVVIPLQAPFQYTGGNLVVRTMRPMDSNYWNISNVFYYTSDTVKPNRSRYQYSDTDDYSVISLPAGTQSSYVPNIEFFVSPYTPITLSAPLVQVALTGATAQLSWQAVPRAYQYLVYGSDDPYNWSAATLLTTTANLNYNITPGAAKKFYRVVARTYGHQARELEPVFSPAIDFDIQGSYTKPDTRK